MDKPAQERRARWLAEHYHDMGLAEFPTFDEIVSHYRARPHHGLVWDRLPEVARRNRHRQRIVEAMKADGLVSPNTRWTRVFLDAAVAKLKEEHGDNHPAHGGPGGDPGDQPRAAGR